MKKLNLIEKLFFEGELVDIFEESKLITPQIRKLLNNEDEKYTAATRVILLMNRYNKFIKKYNVRNIEDFKELGYNDKRVYELHCKIEVIDAAIDLICLHLGDTFMNKV